MASSRLTVPILAQLNLSPRSLRNYLPNARHSLNPRALNEAFDSNESDIKTPTECRKFRFNIDTPNRKRIINNELTNEIRSILGCGGFGTVYKAFYKGDEVAVKIMRRRECCDQSVEAEKLASKLIHPNIIHIFVIEQGKFQSLIIMELCIMSLEEKLEKKILNKNSRLKICKAIASALEFCHRHRIIHGDVKPKNVLIALNGQTKLADFGSSILIDESEEHSNSLHGTPGYAAPELIKGSTPTIQSDIYSLGILAWQLLSRKTPFKGCHPHTVLYLTGKGKRPSDKNIDDECCGEYKNLYQEMWSENASDRPPLRDVIKRLNSYSKSFNNHSYFIK